MNAAHAWHGLDRRYRRARDGAEAGSLRALAPSPLAFDREGVRAAWGLAPPGDRTVLAGVRFVHDRRAPPAAPPPAWAELLALETVRIARAAEGRAALALGGGVDAAAVLAAWRASGEPWPLVVTLATGLAGYDEVDEARAIARALGAPVEIVQISGAALVDLLPDAVRAVEAPLWNLHPVARLALARAAAARGARVLVTGDGADAAFRGEPDLDYVPLVAALARAGGLDVRSPFFADRPLAAALSAAPDARKRPLRAAAVALGVPAALADAPKRVRLTPPLDLSTHEDAAHVSTLASALGEAPRMDTDRARVGWITMSLLARHLEGSG